MHNKNNFPEISRYVFGTLLLKDPERHTRLINMALDAGVWFHSCYLYGCVNDGNLLGKVLKERPGSLPGIICKISGETAEEIRHGVESSLSLMGLEQVNIVQLSRKAGKRKDFLVDDFKNVGPIRETCEKMRSEGKVGHYIMEIFCSCAEDGIEAVHEGLFDGYTFHYSLVQREATNELFDLLRKEQEPVVSMKTATGGYVDPVRFRKTIEEHPDRRDVQIYQRLRELYEASGSRDWLDFTFRFLFSQPNVKATAGGTTDPDHLEAFLEASRDIRPLDPAILEEILKIQAEFMEHV
ncbi:MAG: aldo/keto reductase [Candidatus Sumerlaeota bacterium]